MTKAEEFLHELDQESIATRKVLELVPVEKSEWKPHEKSMALVQLAAHVAEISTWAPSILSEDELDFSKMDYKPFIPKTSEELLSYFEKNLNSTVSLLKDYPDDQIEQDWTMRAGEKIFSTEPRYVALRKWCFNHLYHHRAQLGVYLRLLDIPLPGTYGPSADSHGG